MRALLALVCLALVSCHRRGPTPDQAGGPPAGASSTALVGVAAPVSLRKLGPLRWGPVRDLGAIGVPNGCTIVPPVQRAPLPKGGVRFVAPPGGASELLVAVDENGDGTVDADGVLDASGQPTVSLPWKKLDAPPIVAKSAAGWLSFDTEDLGGGKRRATVWREPGRLEPLVEGDRLEVVDAGCDGATCAVLTTRPSTSAGPGATVFIGKATLPVSSWTRVDLPAEEHAWAPFSVIRVQDGVVWVSLEAEGYVSAWRIDKGRAESVGRIDAPFGVYDVVLEAPLGVGSGPVVVAPGESIEHDCTKDGFAVHLLGMDGKKLEVDGNVPPSSVVTRPLQSGFVVGWLAPVSCKQPKHQAVRAFLVSSSGEPASSTMAVGDASGFALATAGNAVDLWLATTDDLVWLKARCAPVAPKPAASAP